MTQIIPAQIAAITAYITGKLPQHDGDENGSHTLEQAIIIVVVIAAALLVGGLITAAVATHSAGIK